jgi:hypothetical protein
MKTRILFLVVVLFVGAGCSSYNESRVTTKMTELGSVFETAGKRVSTIPEGYSELLIAMRKEEKEEGQPLTCDFLL